MFGGVEKRNPRPSQYTEERMAFEMKPEAKARVKAQVIQGMNSRVGYDPIRGLTFIRKRMAHPTEDVRPRCPTCGRTEKCCCPECGQECPAKAP